MRVRKIACFLMLCSIIQCNAAEQTYETPNADNITTDEGTSSEYHNPNTNAEENTISDLKSDVENLQAQLRVERELVRSVLSRLDDVEKAVRRQSVGSTYVRWGRDFCSSTRSTRIYEGHVGKSFYVHGGGANYQCLPVDPQYHSKAEAGFQQSNSFMYGVQFGESPVYPEEIDHDNAICAVCSVPRTQLLMIPGKYDCPTGWTREYFGYLAAQAIDQGSSSFECLDFTVEDLKDSSDFQDAGYFRIVEGVCGSLPCPPYEDGKELSCVVCTK